MLFIGRQGYRTRYYRVPRLLTELATAKADGSYPRLMNTVARTEVLALDHWGLGPVSAAESRDILEVVDDRSQKRPTIVVSPLDHWYGTIGDPTVADANLDRLLHGAHKLIRKGESMRKVAEVPVTDCSGRIKAQTHRRFAPTDLSGRFQAEHAVDLSRNTHAKQNPRSPERHPGVSRPKA